eukprot:NODE_4915_length_330_cov_176.032028_g4304_i0.p3 GENE.NODE_4915_length_330_cov_176.032028_g4304_i0~~NODE_4915_length_330_cov_176.032028_g4304_i0.p3  ORF type:complete len:68 (+),score=26.67 NODE_4915_length_330_cov_176.032028_g4304_i0:31-204(+)
MGEDGSHQRRRHLYPVALYHRLQADSGPPQDALGAVAVCALASHLEAVKTRPAPQRL